MGGDYYFQNVSKRNRQKTEQKVKSKGNQKDVEIQKRDKKLRPLLRGTGCSVIIIETVK